MHTYPTIDQLGKLAQAKAREAVAAAAQLETALSRWWAVDQDKLEQLVAAAKTANSKLNANLRQLRTARTRATLNRLIWVNETAKCRDDAKFGGQDIFEHLFEDAPDSPASDDILVRGNPAELTRVVTAIFTCLSRRIGVACPPIPIPEIPEQPHRPLYRLRRHIHALLSEATVNKLANL